MDDYKKLYAEYERMSEAVQKAHADKFDLEEKIQEIVKEKVLGIVSELTWTPYVKDSMLQLHCERDAIETKLNQLDLPGFEHFLVSIDFYNEKGNVRRAILRPSSDYIDFEDPTFFSEFREQYKPKIDAKNVKEKIKELQEEIKQLESLEF